MPYRFDSFYYDTPIVPGRALDVLLPDEVTRETALLFVHGGGWRAGSRAGYHPLMRDANRRGFICGSLDYRLSGVHILDQVADVRHGYDLFHDRLIAMDRPRRVVVFGSSAGAHLAALLAFARPGQCGEPAEVSGTGLVHDWVPPVGAALQATPFTFEPWEEIFPHIWTSMQDIVGRSYDEAPEVYRAVSPSRYVNESTPSTFVMHAENEHMFPLEQSERFAEVMTKHNRPVRIKVYPGVEHGFMYSLDRRVQKEAWEDLMEFVAEPV